jgi:hypothetical protein
MHCLYRYSGLPQAYPASPTMTHCVEGYAAGCALCAQLCSGAAYTPTVKCQRDCSRQYSALLHLGHIEPSPWEQDQLRQTWLQQALVPVPKLTPQNQ